MKRYSVDPFLVSGAIALGAGLSWVILQSVGWYNVQQSLALNAQGSVRTLVFRFYVAEALAILVMVAGIYFVCRSLVLSGSGAEPMSIKSILAGAWSSRRDERLGAAVALVYALVYVLVSSILVYQPTVDFGSAYGVTAPGWNVASCCGALGTVPTLLIYLSPQAHVGIQLIPLNALFAVLVPILVGLNISVGVHAARSREVRTNAKWFSSIGVLTGLFTGCPTCAGLFLAGTMGGFGVTTLAVALAPFQAFFIFVSLPLLLVSPLMTAFLARKSMLAACPVPNLPRSEVSLER